MKFATRLVHYDPCPGDPYRPVATPIYQTATFAQESALEFGQYDYSRSGNPTRRVLENQLARLENGSRAFVFASGMAAVSTVLKLAGPGDEVVAGHDLYGGTYRLLSHLVERKEVVVRHARSAALESFREAMSPRTRLLFVESPTNPLMEIVDVRALAMLAHERGAILCVDNSLMSPVLQRPLELGADVVVHSATKFLSGHSDVTAGALVARSQELAEQIYFWQNAEGTALGPFDSYLLLRGLKTLDVRVKRQEKNAARLARYMSRHPAVRHVHYPGLREHPGDKLHAAQARGPGSVVCFETGSIARSQQFVESLKFFAIAVSFGSINSSVSLPSCMSHASIPAAVRASRRLPEDLVRLSVGIEAAADLIEDIEQALGKASGCAPATSDRHDLSRCPP
jgi:cystathionine beta-lyase